MDAVHRLEEATVRQVADQIPNPPTDNAVRTMLGALAHKGYLKRRRGGRAVVYSPVGGRTRAARSALRRILGVFFGGSMSRAVAMYLSDPRSKVSPEEIEEMRRLLAEAEKRGGSRDRRK